MDARTQSLYDVLSSILDPSMTSLLKSLETGDGKDYMVLPDDDIDRSAREISRLIALSSNKYGTACKLASLARARAKVAEARYKYKFRTSLGSGKNKEEREAQAVAAAETEYQEMVFAQALVEMFESVESANRIASESSRRMLLAADQYTKAENRFGDHAGSLTERDFTP